MNHSTPWTNRRRRSCTSSPLRIACSPDGRMLAHGNQNSTVHIWYVDAAQELQMSGHLTKVKDLSWDPSGRYLATGGGTMPCIWDGPRGHHPGCWKPMPLTAYSQPFSTSTGVQHSQRRTIRELPASGIPQPKLRCSERTSSIQPSPVWSGLPMTPDSLLGWIRAISPSFHRADRTCELQSDQKCGS